MRYVYRSLLFVLLLLFTACLAHAEETPDQSMPERLILVNKTHSLSRDYVPDDLIIPDIRFKEGIMDERKHMSEPAARAIEAMFAAALEDGVELVAISGYRSYSTQAVIYELRLEQTSLEHVSRYNAKAGQSEHQTGLAMDISSPDCMVLETWFQETDAYAWLLKHCGEYGFIIRYRENLEEVTGYAFEPWHVRYVGPRAQEIMESGLALEHYLLLIHPQPPKRPAHPKYQAVCLP